jgi:hypothetical protein
MKIILIILIIIPTLGTLSFAQEFSNETYHFSLTLPPNQGWNEHKVSLASNGELKKPLEYLFVASNNSGKKVSLQVIDADSDISMAVPENRNGFKSGMIKNFPNTIRLADEKVVVFAGVPSYQLVLLGTIQGNPINIRMINFNANSFQYGLTVYSADTSKLIDTSFENIISSFRFTDPPVLPISKSNLETQAGAVGIITAYVCIGIIIVFIVIKFSKKRTAA